MNSYLKIEIDENKKQIIKFVNNTKLSKIQVSLIFANMVARYLDEAEKEKAAPKIMVPSNGIEIPLRPSRN